MYNWKTNLLMLLLGVSTRLGISRVSTYRIHILSYNHVCNARGIKIFGQAGPSFEMITYGSHICPASISSGMSTTCKYYKMSVERPLLLTTSPRRLHFPSTKFFEIETNANS
jgi:hypothetical protein